MNLDEKIKDKLSEIKKLVFGDDQVQRIFKDAKLSDGTIVRYDGETPAVGMPLFTISEEGEVAAKDGEYELEDGMVLVVSNGLVVDIKEPVMVEESEQEKKDEQKLETVEYGWDDCMKDQMARYNDEETAKKVCGAIKASGSVTMKAFVESRAEIVDLQIENISLKKEIEATKETFTKLIEDNKSLFKSMYELLSEIASLPTAQPVEKPKAVFHKNEKQDKINKLSTILSKI